MFMSRVGDAGPSLETAETASLVQQALQGDPAAFECLMLRYERQVVRLAMRFLGTTEDAQDAAQEVFFRAYKYLHRLDLQRPIEPWLMRTTVNVCRNIGRKRQRRLSTFSESETASEPAATEFCDPYSGIVEEEERQMLWKALNTLPEKERIAITLRDIEGLPTAEVAAILESSETTVRSQISRARVRMKEAIDEMQKGRK
jgi:RNA polymerase sigma factor (sigma-70 family)